MSNKLRHEIEKQISEAKKAQQRSNAFMRDIERRTEVIGSMTQAIEYLNAIDAFLVDASEEEIIIAAPKLQMYLERVARFAGEPEPPQLTAMLTGIRTLATANREAVHKLKRDRKLANRPAQAPDKVEGTQCEIAECHKPAHIFTHYGNFCKIHARERHLL